MFEFRGDPLACYQSWGWMHLTSPSGNHIKVNPMLECHLKDGKWMIYEKTCLLINELSSQLFTKILLFYELAEMIRYFIFKIKYRI